MRGLRQVIILSIVILLLVSPAAASEDQPWQALFAKANLAYRESRVQEAAERYRELIPSGYATGVLYYNLGNAYFRQGRLGHAILSYERARFFLPRDGDLNFNLRHAYLLVEDLIPESQGLEGLNLFWLDSLRLDEMFWGFAVLNVIILACPIDQAVFQGRLELLPLPCAAGVLVFGRTLFWVEVVPGGKRPSRRGCGG